MKNKPLYLAGTPKPPAWINGTSNPEYTKWLYHNRPGYRDRQRAYQAAKRTGAWKPREGFGDVSRQVEAIAAADRVTTRSVFRWLAAGMPIDATEAQRRAWRKSNSRRKIQPRTRAKNAETAAVTDAQKDEGQVRARSYPAAILQLEPVHRPSQFLETSAAAKPPN